MKNLEGFCQSTAPYIWHDDIEKSKRVIYKTRCKQWSCDYCAKVNKYQHWLRMVKGYGQLQDTGYVFNFVTLTSHEGNRTTLQSYKIWQSAWTKLSTRYRRAHKETDGTLPAYVYIPELHADGALHIHGIFSGTLNQKWWKDNARQCGLGYIAKSIKLEDAVKATNYVLKYITKDMGQDIGIKRLRRINYSRNFPRLPKSEENTSWSVLFDITAIEALIITGWRRDLDVFLQGHEIEEIINE